MVEKWLRNKRLGQRDAVEHEKKLGIEFTPERGARADELANTEGVVKDGDTVLAQRSGAAVEAGMELEAAVERGVNDQCRLGA